MQVNRFEIHKSIVIDANTPLKVVDFIGFYTVFFTSHLHDLQWSDIPFQTVRHLCLLVLHHTSEKWRLGETN